MNQRIKPMLATLIDQPFDDAEWIFEMKWDGFRALAALNGSQVDLYSRNLLSLNERFPELVNHLKKEKLHALLDGEIVALDKEGISRFQLLQNSSSYENIYFYVFDILSLNGKDLEHLPLIERKALLQKVLKSDSLIRYSEHIEGRSTDFFKFVRTRGCEGIIGKKKSSTYQPGTRTKEWVKIKAVNQQEVVICGFTEPRKSRKNLGALVVGVYSDGILTYAGHVGTGFTEKKLKEVKELLAPLQTDQCPFKKEPPTNSKVTWVIPKYLCEVKFQEWTQEKIMRQPVFLGIRSDKPAQSVILEKPLSSINSLSKEYDFITNPEKIFWPDEQITKGELLAYYESMAPFILPYLKDRAESLRRFPNGIDKPHFFQKNLEKHPEWLSTVAIEHEHKMVNYLVIQDIESLLYAVNLGCIEIHPFFSRYQSIDEPDFLLLDLDPVNIEFEAVIETAQVIHKIFDKLNIPSFCKTSGARGIHICVPLKAKYSYEQAKQFAHIIASIAHMQIPEITSLERNPQKRSKKVYIDYLQNNFGQTMAAPYSVRAKRGAPVSTPLEWKEVKKGLNPSQFNMYTIEKRIKKKGDLFKAVLQKGIDIAKAVKRMESQPFFSSFL